MAEKPENSVLFSLKELRRIEDDRVTQEVDDANARDVAETQAREDAARAEEQAVVNTQREEQLRLQEAEARARVEAQGKLDEERMRLEMEGTGRGMPKWVVPSIVGVVVVAAGVLVWLFAFYMPAKDAAQKKAEAARIDQMRKDADAKTKKLLAEREATLQKQLANSANLSKEQVEKLKKQLNSVKEKKAASTSAAAAMSSMRRRRYYYRRRTSSRRRTSMRARRPPKRPNALEGLFQ
jgi:hypothetical protein